MEPSRDASYLSTPKPDLTYAYPIFRTTDVDPSFATHQSVLNFSASFIRELSQSPRALKCTLTNNLLNAKDGTAAFGKLQKKDLMAFPWAIVEVKPEDAMEASEQFCFNQAANASSAAVRMRRNMIEACPGSNPNDISPVVAFTCIGPRVRVWLTYFDVEASVMVSALECMKC